MKHSGEHTSASHVLLGKQTAHKHADFLATPRERALGRLAFVGGAALALIGTTDVALLWIPPHFGNGEWEFATVSATLESLTLAALGYGLLTVAALLRRSRTGLYMLAFVFLLLTLMVLGGGSLFALDVPLAMRGAPPQLKGQLMQHFLKTGVLTIVYLSLFVYLAWLTLSTARGRRES